MSDFLSKFSKDEYEKKPTTQVDKQKNNEVKQQGINTVSGANQEQAKAGNKSITSESKLNGEPDKQHEEIFEFDAESRKNRKRRLIIISAIVAVVIVAGSILIYLSGNIKVPEFVGNQVSDAKVWGVQKGMFIEVEEQFSLEHDTGVVMKQEPKAKTTVRKGDSIKLVVSKGADPEELIPLPDFSTMNKSQIEKWIKDKRADNATIVLEYSDTVALNMFIKKAFRNANVSESNYRRKDVLTITVSKGKEEFEKNIKVLDFIGKNQSEVMAWGETNKVSVQVTEVYSDTVPAGNVVSQSVPANTMISKVDTLNISVSKGKATVVPNFWGMSKEQAQSRAGEAGVAISIVDVYDGGVRFGAFISQSVGAGTILSNPSTVVTLTYSLGVPFVPDLSGKSLQEATQILAGMNNQGANIGYGVVETFDQSVPAGNIIMNDNVGHSGFGLYTTIKVSSGGQVQVPTSQLLGRVFENQETQDMIKQLEARGLRVVTVYYTVNAVVNGQPVKSGEIAELMVLEGSNRRFIQPNEVLNTGSQVLQIVIQK